MVMDFPGYETWKQFVEKGWVNPEVPPLILASWERSRTAGVNPYGRPREVKGIQVLRQRADFLLEASAPVIKLLKQLIEGSGFVIVLVDQAGYVLEVVGDSEVLEMAAENNLVPGANRLEEVAGTNAIGLVLKLDEPVQIVGSQHYNFYHHKWTCSAAPIHDPEGNLVGVFDLSGHYSLIHKHTLGMVAAAARAIEREMGERKASQQLEIAYDYLSSVLESVDEGIIAVDNQEIVSLVNSAVAYMLSKSKEALLGRKITDFIGSLSHPLQEACVRKQALSNIEAFATGFGKSKVGLFVGITPLKGQDGGLVITVREKKEVHKLVHRVAGSQARYTFADIKGADPRFLEAIELAKTIAASPSKVLLQGESGVGKEMFAQAIHNASPRAKCPFVTINCGAIPRELIESELFGYEEGAFTGARRGGKPGKFELADGGTIFLDEISSMSLEMQSRLLRVLQGSSFARVGGTEVINIDVRVIAASNKDLEQEVNEGNFREDLFYRLSVITINIPPLRQRPQDILFLTEQLCEKLAYKLDKPIKKISRAAQELLQAYPWPGNVRELENVIERALLLCRGEEIQVEDLPPKLRQSYRPSMVVTGLNREEPELPTLVAEAERETIERALKATGGNILQASKKLGIARNTLYKKIGKYNIVIEAQDHQ